MEYLDIQGLHLPKLGFGTYRMQGDICRAAVESALALGYRHLDTAEMYANEEAVGAAVAASGLSRGDLHITTKVWHANLAPDALRRSFAISLDKLKCSYVDLYMIHWPSADMDLGATLGAMMKLKDEGAARTIGVCNFPLPLLKKAVDEIGAPIAFEQLEYHVLLDQTPIRNYAASKGFAITAHCPLAQGRHANHPELMAIAAKHGVTPAQVALKWLLDQDNVVAIPKAQRPESQKANLDAFKVKLDDADRAAIAALPKDTRFVSPAFAPAWDPPLKAA